MKTYRGTRFELHRVTVIVVQADGRPRALTHHIRHSPTGFEWGYAGSGPADLARCLLIDVLQEDNPEPELYHAFKRTVVVGLDDAWELTEDQIRQTLDGIKAAAQKRLDDLERADAGDGDPETPRTRPDDEPADPEFHDEALGQGRR